MRPFSPCRLLSSPSTSKPSLFQSMRCYPSMSNWSALLTIAREYRLEVTIIQICRLVSSSVWSVRVRHRHLYAVPHHREELMSCLQFGPCEQFKKNRKTHVHFQQCIHQLVLHQLRAMGDADYRFRVLHSLSMFLIRDESHLFQWWIGWHCPRTWTWYERRMVVLRKWTTAWGRSLWAWRREGIEDTSPVV